MKPASTVHMIGIGGSGMSAIAVLLHGRGYRVQGSDRSDSAQAERLRELGITVHVGHRAEQVDGADVVVRSSAIRDVNPEIQRARELNIEILHRSDALKFLMSETRNIVVAGTHGKTTTSAMIATALEVGGLSPSFAIGGSVQGIGALNGAKAGRSDLFVAEADESDGSFLLYPPAIAIVTNIETDHLGHYGDLQSLQDAFYTFAAGVRQDPKVAIICVADQGSAALVPRLRAAGVQVLTYGGADDADADLRVHSYRADTKGSVARMVGGHNMLEAAAAGGREIDVEVQLSVPGYHTALNAVAALASVILAGLSPQEAAKAVSSYGGTARRFELHGEVGGVRVFDDYAHHPTEVAAILEAARERMQQGRIIALFQPHLYSRTQMFPQEFADALQLADIAVVTDVHGAREDPVPGVTGELITSRMPAELVHYVLEDFAAATEAARLAAPGDMIITLGCGDINKVVPHLLQELAKHHEETT